MTTQSQSLAVVKSSMFYKRNLLQNLEGIGMKFKTESQRDDGIQSFWELFGRISDLS